MPVAAFSANAHPMIGRAAQMRVERNPAAEAEQPESMTALAPTTMPRPTVCSVRMVGYAQSEGDSRVQVASAVPRARRADRPRDRLPRRLLLFRHAAAGDDRAAVGRVIRAQHMPCEPSARDGWPDTLTTVPGLRVSGVQPVRVKRRRRAELDLPLDLLAVSSASK